MTSATNAARARDWTVDADRLLREECRRHDTLPALVKALCRSCLTEALTAAYEAGRADARANDLGEDRPPGGPDADERSGLAHALGNRPCPTPCHCGSTLPIKCDCCGAKAGEPCRHEVSHDP